MGSASGGVEERFTVDHRFGCRGQAGAPLALALGALLIDALGGRIPAPGEEEMYPARG